MRPIRHEERQGKETQEDEGHAGCVGEEGSATQRSGVDPRGDMAERPELPRRDGRVRLAEEGGDKAGPADEGSEDPDPGREGLVPDEEAYRERVDDAADGGARGGDADGEEAPLWKPLCGVLGAADEEAGMAEAGKEEA